MKNITHLYQQLNEGKISKDFFMKNARMQFPQFVSPTLSFRDTVNVLKGKRLIQEAHIMTIDQIIDRLNPYHFRRGVQKELAKIQDPTRDDVRKVNEKVAKRLQKDPMAYEDQIFANAKDIEKKDDKLQTGEVKVGTQSVDKNNAMKVKKKLESANTRATKKENKKGKPRGVKVMTYKAKTAKGISETMPATGKEKVLKVLHENMYASGIATPHNWHRGKEVNTPKGEGKITEIHGGTLTVELNNGGLVEYQMNIVEKYTDKAKQADNTSNHGKQKEDNIKEVTTSLKEFVKKLKEIILTRKKTGGGGSTGSAGGEELAVADKPTSIDMLKKAGYQPKSGTDDVKIPK